MIFNLNIQSTLEALLSQEDTDGDKKITIEDQGPKSFMLNSTVNSYQTTKTLSSVSFFALYIA